MTNALMADIRKRDEEMHSRMFETMMEAFIKRWAPEVCGGLPEQERMEIAQFHAELHMLIRQVYTDAQAPLLAQYIKLVSGMSMYPPSPAKGGAADK